MLYFDHAATTPVHPEVIKKMDQVSKRDFGNPSSVYSSGRAAKSVVELARNEIAKMMGGPTINVDPVIEPRETLADNSKAKELLGWKHSVEIEDWVPKYKKDLGIV